MLYSFLRWTSKYSDGCRKWSDVVGKVRVVNCDIIRCEGYNLTLIMITEMTCLKQLNNLLGIWSITEVLWLSAAIAATVPYSFCGHPSTWKVNPSSCSVFTLIVILAQKYMHTALTSLPTSVTNGSSTAFIPYFLINLFSTTISNWMLLKLTGTLVKGCQVRSRKVL